MPIEPLPITLSKGYFPSRSGAACSAMPFGGPLGGDSMNVVLGLEHFHRLRQALAQPRQRIRQRADLIVTADLKIRRLELTQADAVGERGQARHRTYEHPPQEDVEDHADA